VLASPILARAVAGRHRGGFDGCDDDVYDVYIMMVRKQVYLRTDQDARLKDAAKREGVTEAEIIRRCVDGMLANERTGPRDPHAWAEFMALAEERSRISAAQVARGWTRDELYEDI
jgi:hypothetical protein